MKLQRVTLGADPEFVFVDPETNRVKGACELVRNSGGQFGTDGCPTVAELRPSAANTAHGVILNIKKAIKKELARNRRLLRYSWFAGAQKAGYALGGHIHFGMPLDNEFVRMLDVFLAIPCIRLERKAEGRARKRSYGHLSNVETKPWGFEYRTLATWLGSERKAFAILSVAGHMANLWKSHPDILRALYVEAGGNLVPEEVDMFRHNDDVALAPRMELILKAIERMARKKANRTTIKAVLGFVALIRHPRKADVVMDWEIGGAKLSELRARQELDSQRLEERDRAEAERLVRETATIQAPYSCTISQAETSGLWEGRVAIEGLSINSGDARLLDIFGQMLVRENGLPTRRIPVVGGGLDAGNAVHATVYGRIQEHPDRVMIECHSSRLAAMRNLANYLGSNGISVSIREDGELPEAHVRVGLRRDIREDLRFCRRIVGMVMLVAARRVEGV